jgi:TRAP-type C4-dicarboxylate transport system permease small subunit
MWWPKDINDKKSLYLSLIAGLLVSIINLVINMNMRKEIDNKGIPLSYWIGLALLVAFLFEFIRLYSNIRKNLDNQKVKSKNINLEKNGTKRKK